MSDTVRTLTIESMTRLTKSVNGNPRYEVTFTNGLVAKTRVDATWALEAENRAYQGVPIEVHFDGHGHIVYATAAGR